jgi:hypothetical protein
MIDRNLNMIEHNADHIDLKSIMLEHSQLFPPPPPRGLLNLQQRVQKTSCYYGQSRRAPRGPTRSRASEPGPPPERYLTGAVV